jgi:hypothetical protein
MDGPHT